MGNFLSKVKEKYLTKQDKKIENLIFLIIILIITLIIINSIWNTKEKPKEEKAVSSILTNNDVSSNKTELEDKLEEILTTIKGVGKVKVFINYQESSSMIPLYDETTTTSNTEEGDSSRRN